MPDWVLGSGFGQHKRRVDLVRKASLSTQQIGVPEFWWFDANGAAATTAFMLDGLQAWWMASTSL